MASSAATRCARWDVRRLTTIAASSWRGRRSGRFRRGPCECRSSFTRAGPSSSSAAEGVCVLDSGAAERDDFQRHARGGDPAVERRSAIAGPHRSIRWRQRWSARPARLPDDRVPRICGTCRRLLFKVGTMRRMRTPRMDCCRWRSSLVFSSFSTKAMPSSSLGWASGDSRSPIFVPLTPAAPLPILFPHTSLKITSLAAGPHGRTTRPLRYSAKPRRR